LKILFLESFFGGSHRDFAIGMKEYSTHDIDIVPLPAGNWKWRMRGAGLYFAKHIKNIDKYDLIFASDMMNLADFISISSIKPIPVILYFHENQLTYPLSPEQKVDLQFGYINMSSALAATKVFFNSKLHFDQFISKLDLLIAIMPDFKPGWVKDEIVKKSRVLYPGCRFSESDIKHDRPEQKDEPPLIIWNHRWEWDKQPNIFFSVLRLIKAKNISFRLALLGERYEEMPYEIFENAKKEFSNEIISFKYVKSKEQYISLLKKGSIVVSTAIQENFGIAVVEAVKMGCVPLLPDRLSYPEIMPGKYLNRILYSSKQDLILKLENMLLDYHSYADLRKNLSLFMGKYSWQIMIKEYDREFEKIANRKLK